MSTEGHKNQTKAAQNGVFIYRSFSERQREKVVNDSAVVNIPVEAEQKVTVSQQNLCWCYCFLEVRRNKTCRFWLGNHQNCHYSEKLSVDRKQVMGSVLKLSKLSTAYIYSSWLSQHFTEMKLSLIWNTVHMKPFRILKKKKHFCLKAVTGAVPFSKGTNLYL